MSRRAIDQRFKDCIQTHSPFKKWSPMSWIRYWGVRVGGWWAWMKKPHQQTVAEDAADARAEIVEEVKEEAKADAP